jgi:hypothetical protein
MVIDIVVIFFFSTLHLKGTLYYQRDFSLCIIYIIFIGTYIRILTYSRKLVIYLLKEEFEDTKRVIRICKSKKDRQHNGQKKKDKRTNNDIQDIHIKLKME